MTIADLSPIECSVLDYLAGTTTTVENVIEETGATENDLHSLVEHGWLVDLIDDRLTLSDKGAEAFGGLCEWAIQEREEQKLDQ